jgi:hypothetical protein
MSAATKTNKQAATQVGRKLEITDLNANESRASLQSRSRGRFSEEAMEVLSASKDARDTVEADVLYQRLGNQWYAFTTQNDEVFYSAVTSQQVAEARKDEVARIFAEKDAAYAASDVPTDMNIDALFHQPVTQTGRKTSNGGGNA